MSWVSYRGLAPILSSGALESPSILMSYPTKLLIYTNLLIYYTNTNTNIHHYNNTKGPLWFALAHLHHIYARLTEGAALRAVLVQTTVQLIYTSIFGGLAAVLHCRT